MNYPAFKHVVECSRDKVTLRVRLHENAADDTDYYLDCNVTIRRGSYILELVPLEMFPGGDVLRFDYETKFEDIYT